MNTSSEIPEKQWDEYYRIYKRLKYWLNVFYIVTGILIVLIFSLKGSKYLVEISTISKQFEFIKTIKPILPKSLFKKEAGYETKNEELTVIGLLYEPLKLTFSRGFYLQYDNMPNEFVFHDVYNKRIFSRPDTFLLKLQKIFNLDSSAIKDFKSNRIPLIVQNVEKFRRQYAEKVDSGQVDKQLKAKLKSRFVSLYNDTLLHQEFNQILRPEILSALKSHSISEIESKLTWNTFHRDLEKKNAAIKPLLKTPFKLPYLDLQVELKLLLFVIIPFLMFGSLILPIYKKIFYQSQLRIENRFKEIILPTIKETLLRTKFNKKLLNLSSRVFSFIIIDFSPKIFVICILVILSMNFP